MEAVLFCLDIVVSAYCAATAAVGCATVRERSLYLATSGVLFVCALGLLRAHKRTL